MKIDLYTQYTTITCCSEACGITFAVPDSWKDHRVKDKTTFFCPNGHSQFFPGQTQAQKLRKQIKFIEKENERCMLNLKKKNQDLVVYRMADKEELFVKDDHYIAHIKKSNGASEIGFMCGYKAEASIFNKIESVQEGQWLCTSCTRAMKTKNESVV